MGRNADILIIKVSGISKTGFSAAMKEYSFFPFDNPTIASGSPAGEREAIIGYKDNQEIQNKICESFQKKIPHRKQKFLCGFFYLISAL